MRNLNFFRLSALSLAALTGLGSCSDDKDVNSGVLNEGISKYVVAATSSEATYLLTTDKLNEGETSILNNGTEVDNATTWLFWNDKYAYRLVYNQGNAGVTTSYLLNEYGEIEERNISHIIKNRFTTYGIYKDYIITAASGATDKLDQAGNPQYGITFTKINTSSQTLSTETVVSEDMTGTGEYCTISGILQSKDKIYAAVCPEGISVYGVHNNSDKLSADELALVNSEGGITGAVNPNSVWVAIYDGVDFSNPRIIKDDRISYATSRYRSQYYQTMDTDSDGNIYVFSSSYATIMDGIQKTSLPSGVVRIKAGEENFDTDYYVNLEDASVADRAMYKVWHITQDYFLMQMYAEKTDDKSYTANTNKLGIFKAGDKKFTWITGLPNASDISSFSKNAYCDNGMAYIAVTPLTSGAKPIVYEINPLTGVANPGLNVTAEGIAAIGKLNN